MKKLLKLILSCDFWVFFLLDSTFPTVSGLFVRNTQRKIWTMHRALVGNHVYQVKCSVGYLLLYNWWCNSLLLLIPGHCTGRVNQTVSSLRVTGKFDIPPSTGRSVLLPYWDVAKYYSYLSLSRESVFKLVMMVWTHLEQISHAKLVVLENFDPSEAMWFSLIIRSVECLIFSEG